MIDQNTVREIVQEWIFQKSNFFLVDISVSPSNAIVVEIDSFDPLSIDDCIVLHHFIEARLDRDVEDYELEVGSFGLGAPFKVKQQYEKNIGNEVEVLLKSGQKKTGVLKSVDQAGFILIIKEKVKPEGSKRKIEVETELPLKYEEIKYTKYLIRFK